MIVDVGAIIIFIVIPNKIQSPKIDDERMRFLHIMLNHEIRQSVQ